MLGYALSTLRKHTKFKVSLPKTRMRGMITRPYDSFLFVRHYENQQFCHYRVVNIRERELSHLISVSIAFHHEELWDCGLFQLTSIAIQLSEGTSILIAAHSIYIALW